MTDEPELLATFEQATGPQACPGAGYRTTGEPGHLHCPICRQDFGDLLTAPNHDLPVINPL